MMVSVQSALSDQVCQIRFPVTGYVCLIKDFPVGSSGVSSLRQPVYNTLCITLICLFAKHLPHQPYVLTLPSQPAMLSLASHCLGGRAILLSLNKWSNFVSAVSLYLIIINVSKETLAVYCHCWLPPPYRLLYPLIGHFATQTILVPDWMADIS